MKKSKLALLTPLAVVALVAALMASVASAQSQEPDVTGFGDPAPPVTDRPADSAIDPDSGDLLGADTAPAPDPALAQASDDIDGPSPVSGAAVAPAASVEAPPPVNPPEPGTSVDISFAEAATAGDGALPPYVQLEIDTAARHRFVSVDSGALAADLAAETVTVELFDGVTANLATSVAPSPAADGTLAYGADGAGGTDAAAVTIAGDNVVGQWWVGGTQYGMLPTGDGNHVIFEVARQFDCEDHLDCANLDDHDDHDEEDVWINPATDLTGGDTAGDIIGVPVISLLVVVDADAVTFYGGSQDTARQQVSAMLNVTNQAYRNSLSGQHVNLAGISFVGSSGTTNMNTYLDRLTSKTDGFIDFVHTTRDSLGADLIALISGPNYPGLCGLAWLPSSTGGLAFNAENRAYNISRADCAVGGLTFSHEIAHNQCAQHDNTSGCGPYADARGLASSAANQRTIMAVNSNPQPRVPYYSNPSVNFPGTAVATGITGSRDNHRVMEIEDLAGISGGLANYRAGTQTVSVAGNDGASCIFATIEQAIDLSAPGSTIYVAPGTHPAQTSGVNYNIGKNLTVTKGDAQCRATATAATSSPVVLRPAAGSTNDAVVEVFAGANVTLDRIIVENGSGIEGTLEVEAASTVTLAQGIVRNGTNAGGLGGGVRVVGGSTFIATGSYLVGNNSAGSGGGIYVDGGVVTLDGVGDVDGNSATSDGGGIYAVNSTVNVLGNADVQNNTAGSNDGGGVSLDASTLNVAEFGSTIWGNTGRLGAGVLGRNGSVIDVQDGGTVAFNSGDFGAGVWFNGGTVRLDDGGSVSNNTGTGGGNGGGILLTGSALADLNPGSVVSGNTTPGLGGGVFVISGTTLDADGGTTAVEPVSIRNNTAASGGGVYVEGTARLDTVHVSNNTAASGGGLFVGSTGVADVTESFGCIGGAADLGFERYCNEFRNNTALTGGAAVTVEGGRFDAVQTGFVANSGGLGTIYGSGVADIDIKASMLLSNTGVSAGNGVITIVDNAFLNVVGVTFADNNERAMDVDGVGTATANVARVITTNGSYGLNSPTTSCNLVFPGSGGLPGAISADARFEPTADTAYQPAPLGPAGDRCALLGGHGSDVFDRGAIDADGVASTTEWDIGGVEAFKQPIITPGAIGGPEGDSGISIFPVPVRLDEASSQPITVDWQTVDTPAPGVATGDVDYIAASGTVTFAPGETEQVVNISVIGDTIPEVNFFLGEWGLVVFSNPSVNAELNRQFFGLGVFIIGNDDGPPP